MAESDVQLLQSPAALRARARPYRQAWLAAALPELRRLSIGVAGPVAVAGTQFAASLLLWGHASAEAFGLFAFLILLIQFSQGLSNALVGTPISVAPHDAMREVHRDACLATHALLLAAVATVIAVVFLLVGMRASTAAFVALAVTANLRWAARSFAIADEKVGSSTLSDGVYAGGVALALGLLLLTGRIDTASVALALTAANVVALAALSRPFLARQIAALDPAALRHYRAHIWPSQSRWALAGVVSTEASSNAHAYAVTWLCGPAVFAPLAFGALFCRPLTIFLTALTQIDRPIFVRLLSESAWDRIRGLLRMNFVAVAAIWLGNLALALGVLWLFEGQITKRGYDVGDIRLIVAIWFAIMALRAARNPLSTYVQASRAFRPLAFCSLASATLSLAAVPALTLVDPTWSLFGVLCGELLLLGLVVGLAQKHFGRDLA